MLSAEQVDIDLGVSRLYLMAITGVCLTALGGLITAGLAPAFTAALSLAVLLSSVDAARQHGFRTGNLAVTRVVCDDSSWHLWLASGLSVRVQCRGDIVVLRWLVVLNFVDEKSTRIAVVVLPDATGGQAFRRLKVFLRLFNRSAVEQAAYPGPRETSPDSRA